jgi:hypothetical protein
MNILLELNNASKSVKSLEQFISENFNSIFDFFSLLNHTELAENRKLFKSLILHVNTYDNLDFDKNGNVAFLDLLINASIRLGDRMFFESIYNLMISNGITINGVTKASALYMVNATTSNQLIELYDNYIDNLKTAFNDENDSANEESIIASLFNYYGLFITDFEFALEQINILKEKIWTSYNDKNIYFINNQIIEKLYYLDLTEISNSFNVLQNTLDNFLGRTRTFTDFDIGNYIIENDGPYFDKLASINCSFPNLLSLNKIIYSNIKSNAIFYSLEKGVAKLSTEEQLYAYIYSYGNMHNKKILSAFNKLPKSLFSEKLNIIDWACGQGIATVSYFDYLKEKSIDQNINKVYLIEPSTITLKRASLHVNNYTKEIITINKDLDSLSINDFNSMNSKIYLHLFSNILDIEFFSMNKLLKLLSQFQGTNYFVIASPFIDTSRTGRINSFVNNFSKKNNFKEFERISETKGNWSGTNWSRVIRVFKTEI